MRLREYAEEILTYSTEEYPQSGGPAFDKTQLGHGYPHRYFIGSLTQKDKAGNVQASGSYTGQIIKSADGKIDRYTRVYQNGKTITLSYTYTCP